MNNAAAYIVACHLLRSACINKCIDCEEYCIIIGEKQPCSKLSYVKKINR